MIMTLAARSRGFRKRVAAIVTSERRKKASRYTHGTRVIDAESPGSGRREKKKSPAMMRFIEHGIGNYTRVHLFFLSLSNFNPFRCGIR